MSIDRLAAWVLGILLRQYLSRWAKLGYNQVQQVRIILNFEIAIWKSLSQLGDRNMKNHIYNKAHSVAILQWFSSLDEDSSAGTYSSAHHHSSGRGQTQSTRTRNHQDRDGVLKHSVNIHTVTTRAAISIWWRWCAIYSYVWEVWTASWAFTLHRNMYF